ncbi:hypothetical protein [Laceyella putida]|uniref:Uncharacterized protein n=1 Tax=Laceyella putida TaxID=110101 RepID=A0ABW2RMD7_9BACL
MYQVETHGLEEHHHPFYVIRYAITEGEREILASVARYVHTNQGGRVQLLEPDMKKILRMPAGNKQWDEVERVVKEAGAQYVRRFTEVAD